MNRRAALVSAVAALGGYAVGRLFPGQRQAEGPEMMADVGTLYHQWSKPGYPPVLGTVLDWGRQPERYKTYPGAERTVLPDPHGYRGLGLEESVERRRSRRDYSGKPLALVELARLLHAAQGITQRGGEGRAAPSAGALYPIEVYVAVHGVTDLAPGIYHYAVREHALDLVGAGDVRATLTQAGLGQGHVGLANVCFVLSAIFQRARWKYRERTYRYVLLEAGHIGQNLYLAATAMGLGACAVGAFLDDDLNSLLKLDGKEEAALYMITVGRV